MGPADASRWSLESDPDALLDHPSLQPDRIADTNIFLSSAFTEGALEVLKRHGITHILQAGVGCNCNDSSAARPCVRGGINQRCLITYLRVRACLLVISLVP
jgi:hypothetical protein